MVCKAVGDMHSFEFNNQRFASSFTESKSGLYVGVQRSDELCGYLSLAGLSSDATEGRTP